MIDETHNPALTSWVESARGHPDFPVQNLPFGIFSPSGGDRRPGVAIGDAILDLRGVAGLLPAEVAAVVQADSLNALFALPAIARRALRRRISELLSVTAFRDAVAPHLHDAAGCTLHMPTRIGDYSDFYVGIHHARNIGAMFRPDSPLLPNYRWVPIGYHGRASSVRMSGEPVRRPKGQIKPPDADAPVFAPTRRLDFELEMGVWIGPGNAPGEPVQIDAAGDHIAGYCLLNDWSARDIQAWEYQPLGPFLSKSFHSTISPWVVTAEALAPFRVAQAARAAGDPRPLDYLWSDADQAAGALNVELEVHLSSRAMRERGMAAHRISQGSATSMYWTPAQMVTHHSSNGCNLQPGDLLGTGTISGETQESCGSLIEMSRGGKTPVTLPGGETRSFLEDGDEVTLSARARADGFVSIGFGPCCGRIAG
ncbi:fumarylacetoacetase [Sphingobium amiense]|uniref:fumarylacetoacetase n=1 Tax=Sphingobium amiense TaxID=135719 RepID=A0A494W4H1_9SPHN|nr:fumarylacetoacetase [Sphingobium amiense]BBD99503.1 fumarylacetoacetase [Sphingobium amiense]